MPLEGVRPVAPDLFHDKGSWKLPIGYRGERVIQCFDCEEWERGVLMRGYCKKFKRESMSWESCTEVSE